MTDSGQTVIECANCRAPIKASYSNWSVHELTVEMHALSVFLWNRLEAAAGDSEFPERDELEAMQAKLKEWASR